MPKDPLDQVPAKDFDPKHPWGMDANDAEKSMPLSFRVKPRYYHLMERLRTDPRSPYYGKFATDSEFIRHIFIRGVVAITNLAKSLGQGAEDIILREKTAAEVAYYANRRGLMQKSTEELLRGLADHIAAGSEDLAIESLDAYLENLLGMEKRWRDEYAKKLLGHQQYAMVAKVLRKDSKFLDVFEQEYGGSHD